MRAQSGGRARASPARGEATPPRSDRSPPAAPRPSSLKGANPKTQKSQMRFHLRPTAERRCDLYPTPRYPNPNPNPNRSTPAVLCYLMVLYGAVLSGLPALRNTGGSCRRVPPERARWLGTRRPAGERGWGRAARTHTQGQMEPSDLSEGAAARRGTRAMQGMIARCRGLLRQTVYGLARWPPPSSNQCKGKALRGRTRTLQKFGSALPRFLQSS